MKSGTLHSLYIDIVDNTEAFYVIKDYKKYGKIYYSFGIIQCQKWV